MSEATLTDVQVTFSMAAPNEDTYVRCGKLPTAYVWASYEEGNAPIVEVRVVEGDAEVPEGFEMVANDINQGVSGKQFFVCVKRKGESDEAAPLTGIRIISSEEPVPEGHEKVGDDLAIGEDNDVTYSFYVKNANSEKSKSTEFEVNELVDCKDTVQKWCVGRIVDKKDNKYLLHYEGWSDKWNEWIPKSSDRIAV